MTELCLSIDVEEDLPGVLPPGEVGITEGFPRLLRFLDEEQIKADFFFLSSVARRYPKLVIDCENAGHLIGNHGWDHEFLSTKPPKRQREEIERSTNLLSSLSSSPVTMFRAPNFSVDHGTLVLLQAAGYNLDSSVLPGRYIRQGLSKAYDHRGARREPHYPIQGAGGTRMLEIPVTENPLQPGTPLGQGALNSFGGKRILDLLLQSTPSVAVFLIHPWELIDLKTRYPQLSDGYARVCSSDLGPLRAFIREAARHFRFTTLSEVTARVRRSEGSCR